MHISAGSGVGRIDVAVGIDPDQPDFLLPPAVELRDPGDGAHGNGVIAA